LGMIIVIMRQSNTLMRFKTLNLICQAVGLGVIAGMRTFSAPAVISHVYSRRPSKNLEDSPFNLIQSINTSKVFKVLAAGELIGDKLPNTPNRTSAGGLTGRILSGSLAGAVVYKANGKQPLIGALIGSTAAIASAFGCMFLRKALGKSTRIPDPYIGALEDVSVICAATILAKRL
jgi:uncharacterized membrane protein